MKTCISGIESSTVSQCVRDWQAARRIENTAVMRLALALGVSEDYALDLLNQHDTARKVLDVLGVEVLEDDSIDQQKIDGLVYGDMLAVDWVLVAIFAGCIGCVILAAYFIWGL